MLFAPIKQYNTGTLKIIFIMNAGVGIGVIILLIGMILLVGNITGWWPTFSYAGFFTMLFGGMITKFAKDN